MGVKLDNGNTLRGVEGVVVDANMGKTGTKSTMRTFGRVCILFWNEVDKFLAPQCKRLAFMILSFAMYSGGWPNFELRNAW